MNTRVLASDYVIVAAQAKPETALEAGSLPASGSYVDVSGYARVHILAHIGTVAAGDAPTLEPKIAEKADGTLDVITTGFKHTVADDDDGEFVSWTIETRKLPKDHTFLAVVVGGTLEGSYADIVFILEGHSLPVTQSELPAASQYTFVG